MLKSELYMTCFAPGCLKMATNDIRVLIIENIYQSMIAMFILIYILIINIYKAKLEAFVHKTQKFKNKR